MAFQPVPDTCKFDVVFSLLNGERMQFSLYARNAAVPWDLVAQNAKRDALRASVEADLIPVLSNQINFVEIRSRDMEAEFPVFTSDAVNPAVPGSLVSPQLPNAVAICTTLIGVPGGAPQRGRIFLPPPAESQVVGELLDVTPQGDLQAAVESMIDALAPGLPDLTAVVIVSRYAGSSLVSYPDGTIRKKPTKRPTALTNPVDSALVKRRTDTQRKRAGVLDPV